VLRVNCPTTSNTKENGLKDKVEVETIPSPVKYEKDASRAIQHLTVFTAKLKCFNVKVRFS